MALVACGAAHGADLQDTFVEAEKALAAGDRARFATLYDQLTDYPLQPYLAYHDLKSRLHRASADEVAGFLRQHKDTPLAWQLRRKWLKRLAKQRDWKGFLRFYRPTDNITLQCQQLRALINTGQQHKALPRVEALWLHGKSRPDACDPVFAHWQRQGNPSPQLAWKRIALALDAGQPKLARYLSRSLPTDQRRWADYWLALHRDPASVTSRKAPGRSHPYLQRMLVHAVRRLAYREPLQALALWHQLAAEQVFSDRQQRSVETRLAAALLRESDPAAAEFYRSLEPRSGDGPLHELRLRAALARQDWASYKEWYAELPPALQDQPRWRYWQARALGTTGESQAAEQLYARLAEERSYHGFLAADRAGLPYALDSLSAPVDTERLLELADRPAMQRARELHALGRTTAARREWQLGTAELDRDGLISAAKLAESWRWHSQAIFTVAQGQHWDDLPLRFPLAHRDTVVAQAERQTLDPAWVYAVARQESAFMTDARSGVGATGLMQLMPATARQVARTLPGRMRVTARRLRDPVLNITLGAAYLRQVLDRLFSNRVLATAAYNAGPHRVQRWLPEQGAMAADLWIELVPYKETRKYLRRVLTYTAIYQSRMGRSPERLLDRMPDIRPAPNTKTAGIDGRLTAS